MKPLLCRIAEEKPLLLFGGRMYEIGTGLSSKDFIAICGIRKDLKASEELLFLENHQYAGELERLMSLKAAEISEEEKKLDRDFKSLEHISIQNEFLDVIRKVMMEFGYDPDACIDKSEKAFREKEKSCQRPSIKDLRRKSIFSELMGEKALFIIQGMCYELARKNTSGKGSVTVSGNTFGLKFSKTLDELTGQYKNKISLALSKIAEQQTLKERKHISEERKRMERIKERMRKIPSITGVGYYTHGNDYYVWKEVPSIILESSVDGGTKFRFPSCKIALKLTKRNKRICIDDSLESGRIRVLEAKTVNKGSEKGGFKGMKGKPYVFPSSITTEKNPYPYICIGKDVFSNNAPSNKVSIERCIVNILNHAKISMEYGYYDKYSGERRDKVHLYHYLDKESDRELFFNFRINNRSSRYSGKTYENKEDIRIPELVLSNAHIQPTLQSIMRDMSNRNTGNTWRNPFED